MLIEDGGLQTSIQDSGRLGLMDKGISRGGVMDTLSAFFANWLVARKNDHPVIEIAMTGPSICFEESLTVAVTGAQFDLTLNGKPQPMNENFDVNQGDKLVFGRCHKGIRAYLSVCADWEIPKVLGGYGTHLLAGFGGFKGRALQAQDRINLINTQCIGFRKLPDKFLSGLIGHYFLRCVPCVETLHFPQNILSEFTSRTFTVSPLSNRMGVRLSGDPLSMKEVSTKKEQNEKSVESIEDDASLSSYKMLSTGLMTGNIQLPPAGLPIIAGMDAQTIGGYPRIAHVIQADWPQVAQLKPQDSVRFLMVDEHKARELYQGQQRLLDELESVYATGELSSNTKENDPRGAI